VERAFLQGADGSRPILATVGSKFELLSLAIKTR
jgi:hypothetical protein